MLKSLGILAAIFSVRSASEESVETAFVYEMIPRQPSFATGAGGIKVSTTVRVRHAPSRKLGKLVRTALKLRPPSLAARLIGAMRLREPVECVVIGSSADGDVLCQVGVDSPQEALTLVWDTGEITVSEPVEQSDK